MPIDWNLAQGSGGGFSALEALQAFGVGRRMAQEDVERERQAQARAAMSDYVLARSQPGVGRSMAVAGLPGNPQGATPTLGSPSPQTPAATHEGSHSALALLQHAGMGAMQPPAPAPTSGPSPADQAFQRLAQVDPQAAMQVRQMYSQMTTRDLEFYSHLNDAGLQMLMGVNDQASLDRARQQALNLYGRLGIDPGEINALPTVYDPHLINGLRDQLLTRSQQLSAFRADRRLNWDIDDDEIDNERADEQLDALIAHRQEQRALTRRGQDLTHERVLRGQDISSRDRRRGQDLTAGTARRGQDIRDSTTRRGQDQRDATTRRGQDQRGRGTRGRGGGNSARATLNGRTIVVRGNGWVYEDNGQPAQ